MRYKAEEAGMAEGARRATGTMPAPGGSKKDLCWYLCWFPHVSLLTC